MKSFPTIKTERLILREITNEDKQRYFEIFSNDLVTEFYNWDSFTDISSADEMIKIFISQYEGNEKTALRWGISLLENPGRLIGTCGYHGTSFENKSFEIGYDLDPEYWNKGLATEAVSAMIDYCYGNNFPFKVNRIRATTYLESARSISVLKKLSFKEEGILRECGYWKNRFHDLRLFSLLRKEWQERNSSYKAPVSSTDDDIIIRQAKISDVPAIAELWKEFIDIQKGYEPFFTRTPDGHEQFARLLSERIKNDDDLWHIIVAEIGGNIAGYCYLSIMEYPPIYVSPKYGYIYNMAVSAEHRSKGIARRLFDASLEWFRLKGITAIQGDVISSNAGAHTFWEKMGFSIFMEKYFLKI